MQILVSVIISLLCGTINKYDLLKYSQGSLLRIVGYSKKHTLCHLTILLEQLQLHW